MDINWLQNKPKHTESSGKALVLFLLLLMTSCNELTKRACGELTGKHKRYVDHLNTAYEGQLRVQQVPCYPGYLEVKCLVPAATSILDSIESSAAKLGWMEVLVYDSDGKLQRGNTISM